MKIEIAVAALVVERDKLAHRLRELGADELGELTTAVGSGDDAAAATVERGELLGIVDNVMSMLADVNLALARVQEGTYGSCVECGESIGEARLEFRPTSTRCVECKSRVG